MAMLHRNKFYFILLYFILIFYLSGCNSDKNEDSRKDQFASTEVMIDFVNLRIGTKEYWNIWNNANDSIASWETSKLQSWTIDTSTVEFQLDSIICINNVENKVVMAHLGRQLTSIGKLDGIAYLYGVKIKNEWVFFSGPTMYIPRNRDSLATPTTFTKLHEIVVDNIFKGYLKKNKQNGEWEINEAWFTNQFEGPGWDRNCKTQECYEKLYLAKVRNNWKQRDSTNYNPLQ